MPDLSFTQIQAIYLPPKMYQTCWLFINLRLARKYLNRQVKSDFMTCGVALRKNSWLVVSACFWRNEFLCFLPFSLPLPSPLQDPLPAEALLICEVFFVDPSTPPPIWCLPVCIIHGILPSSWYYPYSCVFSSACGSVSSLRVDSWPAVDALPVPIKGVETQASVCPK